jgi:cysteine dioxygenase
MSFLTIDEWVSELVVIPEGEFTIPRMQDFIGTKAIHPETLAPHVFYAKSHYTRNLIYSSDLFEVLAICWDIGQVNPPHDHGGQNCWMVTPIGRLRVQNFRVEMRDPAQNACRLITSNSFDMDAEHRALVEPDDAVHQVFESS